MLGFVLGALFVLALPRHRLEAPPEPKIVAAKGGAEPAVVPRIPPRLTVIEAVFAEWGKYAVWNRDVTEVALWNVETKDFTDACEVIRVGDDCYFRSITRLTRPVLTHGLPANSPLRYTETEEQRQEWLKARGEESWRAVGQVLAPHLPASTPGDKHP